MKYEAEGTKKDSSNYEGAHGVEWKKKRDGGLQEHRKTTPSLLPVKTADPVAP